MADKTAFFDDFESGALDAERWQVPTAWGVERARLRPWQDPGLPVDDGSTSHLSDSPYAGAGRYRNATQSALETNWIDLTEATAGVRLRITHRYDIEARDDAALVFARADTVGWTLISPEGGYPTPNGYAGYSLGWEVSSFDLSTYGGSRLKLAFQVLSGRDPNVGDGWQVDSVSVTFTSTTPQPDLRLTGVEVFNSIGSRISTGTAGDALELRANVTNVGSSSTTTKVPVFFFDGTPSQGRFLGQAQLASVPPQAVATAAIRAVLGPGNHTVSAVVDPGRILVELSTANNAASTALMLNAASGVDLAILTASLEVGGRPTDGARPAQIVSANLTVANLGIAAHAGGYTYGVYLEGSGTPSRLAEESRSFLAAGETRAVAVNFSAIPGNLSLLVVIDFANSVAESNEGNNEVRFNFTVTDTPPRDLVVAAVAVTFSGQPTNEVSLGQLLVIRATVRNQGTQPVEGSFTVGVFLGDPDAGGSLLWTRTVPGGLAPNATAEVRGTWASEVGQRTLYAYADFGRVVFEADELNNKHYASVHVQGDQRANLVVQGVRFRVLGAEVNATQAGAPVVVEVTFRNSGINTTVLGEVALSRANPWVTPLQPTVLRKPLPGSVVRNTDYTVTFDWVAEPGSATFLATLDSGRATDEVSEFDNQLASTLAVSADSPDLAVGAVSIRSAGLETSTVYPELNVTVSAEVTNAGSAAVQTPFVFQLWAGEPDTLGAVRLAARNVSAPFDAGDTVQISVTWFASMPTAGSWQIVARADPARSIVEVDRANNEAVKDFTFVTSQAPNLAVTRFAVTRDGQAVTSATSGDALAVEVTVKNDSPAPYLGGAVLEVRDGPAVVYTSPLPRLEPGQELQFRGNWTASAGADLRAIVDSLGAVDESDEADNQNQVALSVEAVQVTPWGLYGVLVGALMAAGVVGLVVMRRRKGGETTQTPTPIGPAPSRAQVTTTVRAPPPRPQAPPPGARPQGPPPRPQGGAPPPGARPPPRPMGAPTSQGTRGPPPGGRGPPPGGARGPPPPGWRPPPQGGRPMPPPGARGPPPPGQRGPPPPGWRPPPQGGRPGPPPGQRGPPRTAPPPVAPAAPVAPLPEAPAPAAPAPPAAPGTACPRCASPIEAEWVLCPNCNAELKAPAAPAVEAPAAEAAPAAPAAEAPAPAAAPPAPTSAAPPAEPSPAPAKCPQCGDPTEAGWTVCPNCGTSLGAP